MPVEASLIFVTPYFGAFLTALAARGDEEIGVYYSRSEWDSDELKSESDAYLDIGQAYSSLGLLPTGNDKRSLTMRHQGAHFESEAQDLAEAAAKAAAADWEDGSDPDDAQERANQSTSNTELLRIFDDL